MEAAGIEPASSSDRPNCPSEERQYGMDSRFAANLALVLTEASSWVYFIAGGDLA